jgi:hypothetical protein
LLLSGDATATSRTVGDLASVSIAASSASTSAGESIQYPGPSTPGVERLRDGRGVKVGVVGVARGGQV